MPNVGPETACCRQGNAGHARRAASQLCGALVVACVTLGTWKVAGAAEVLIDGLAWRQLPETAAADLSWNELTSVCPLDETPCEGSVNGVDFTGWTLASYERVQTMLDTLTGFSVPATEPYDSPIELFHERFHPVLDNSSVGLSYAYFAPASAPDTTVDVIQVQDAKVSAGGDKLVLEQVAPGDASVTDGFFGTQPISAFLVRDPDLELCSNGRDDDGDGQADGLDSDCPAGQLSVDTVQKLTKAYSAALSPDGGFVIFECEFPGVICSHDVASGTTDVILENLGSWWRVDAERISVSDNAEFVAFEGVVQEGNPTTVNLYNRSADSIEIISVLPDGTPAAAASPTITPDGRYVAFVAFHDLIADDTNDDSDVYLFDRHTGVLELISIAYDGSQGVDSETGQQVRDYPPGISDDGNQIVFNSYAPNMVPDDTNNEPDIFLVDRAAGSIERVNLGPNGEESFWTHPLQFSFSGDGTAVAWTDSDGRDLVDPETSGDDAIFLRDLSTASTRLLYQTAGGGFPNEPVGTNDSMPISRDGSAVLYISDATNIVADDANGDVHDLFLHDRAAGATSIVSLDETGEQFTTSGLGFTFDMSADARRIAYEFDNQLYVTNLQRTTVPTPEACDNTLDDDGDGLIDDLDLEDCPRPIVGLQVRCTHDPAYVPETGGVVTLRAQAIGRDGQPVVADSVSISLGPDWSEPEAVVTAGSEVTVEFPPAGTFSYACSATSSVENAFSGRRTVAVEGFDDDFPAVPVLFNGPLEEKIDIVFFPDRDEYASSTDPDFIEDVGLLINGGYLTIPWYVEHQDEFNFWIGTDMGNSGPDPDNLDSNGNPLCFREAPDQYKRTYSFADSAGIVHRSSCRDNAGSPGIFTIEVDLNRLQVVAHESGHRPFGLADEYCCDGGYFTRQLFGPPYPNMFKREAGCRNKGEKRGHDPDACRSLTELDTGKDWWLFEPVYKDVDPQPGDMMQQTGCVSLDNRAACRSLQPTSTGPDADPNGVVPCAHSLDTYHGDPDGIPDNDDDEYWMCRSAGTASDAVWVKWRRADRYAIGASERDRLRWFLSECNAGRC